MKIYLNVTRYSIFIIILIFSFFSFYFLTLIKNLYPLYYIFLLYIPIYSHILKFYIFCFISMISQIILSLFWWTIYRRPEQLDTAKSGHFSQILQAICTSACISIKASRPKKKSAIPVGVVYMAGILIPVAKILNNFVNSHDSRVSTPSGSVPSLVSDPSSVTVCQIPPLAATATACFNFILTLNGLS